MRDNQGMPRGPCSFILPADCAASSRAHAAITAILKRLAHRNPTVQLYALSLTESLGKNLGIEIHREIASRAFIQGLEKLITDRVRSPSISCISFVVNHGVV